MKTTKLELTDSLPLTCSRSGTCCHGNLIRLNPWELSVLAKAKQLSLDNFRKAHTSGGGAILLFDGKPNHTGNTSCSLYLEGKGCSIHPARPLACRLYPLGRQIQNEIAQYIFQGDEFPCFKECPEVKDLPYLTVEKYISGQETTDFELAQDLFLELMQNCADISLSLLLDTDLATSGANQTIAAWRKLGSEDVHSLAKAIGEEWMSVLMASSIQNPSSKPDEFVENYTVVLQTKLDHFLNSLHSLTDLQAAAQLSMAISLYLAYSIGANTQELSEHWISIAKQNGAIE